MRVSLIAAVSAVALLGGAALAQTVAPSPAPGTASPAPGAARAPGTATPGAPAVPGAVAPRVPLPNPLTMEDTSKIKGNAVYGSDDKKIGDIATILMRPESKTIDRLVINAGGVLGIGGHSVALPVDAFKWDGTKEAFIIDKTADQLKAMPEWKSASAGLTAQ